MPTDPALWIFLAAGLSGLLCGAIGYLLARRKNNNLYNRGWMAARNYQAQLDAERQADFARPSHLNFH